jgi:starch phosphorylase
MLYNTLEREIIPLFYERNQIGLPINWIGKMKAAIQMAGERFSAQFMLRNYTNNFYVPALKSSINLQANDYNLTRETTTWLQRMTDSWNEISIQDVDMPNIESTVFVGHTFPISIKVHLGNITPDDVRVEFISGRLNSQEQILNYTPVTASLIDTSDGQPNPNENGSYTFTGEVTCIESGRFGVAARVIPKNDNLPHTFKPKLIAWW